MISVTSVLKRETLRSSSVSAADQTETSWQTLSLPSNLSLLSFFFSFSSSPTNLLVCYWGGWRGALPEALKVCIIPVLIWWSQSELTIVLSSWKTWRLTTNPERDKTLPVPVLAYKPKQRAQLTRRAGGRPAAAAVQPAHTGVWHHTGWGRGMEGQAFMNQVKHKQLHICRFYHRTWTQQSRLAFPHEATFTKTRRDADGQRLAGNAPWILKNFIQRHLQDTVICFVMCNDYLNIKARYVCT